MTRNIVLSIVLALLGSPTSGGQSVSAQTPAKPPPLTEKQKELLKERDRLIPECRTLQAQGKLAEAVVVVEKVLALERQIFGDVHDEIAGSLNWLANLWEDGNDFADALKALQESLSIQIMLYGDKSWQVTDARLDLARNQQLARMDEAQRQRWSGTRAWIRTRNGLIRQGKYAEATVFARKIVVSCRTIWGEEHRETSRAVGSLGYLLRRQNLYEEAEKQVRRCLAIELKVLGEEHPHTAASYAILARDLFAQGQYAEAAKLDRQALAIRLKVLKEEHPDTANSYNNLARDLFEQAQYAEAEKLDRQALAIHLKVLKEEHPNTATSYNNLASDLHAQGQYAKAEKLDRQALAIRLKVLKEEHRDTATSYNNLACALFEQGQYAEAEKLDRQALAIRLNVLKEEHPDTASSYANLASVLFAQGQYVEAEKLDRQALAIRLKVLKEEHRDTATSYANLAAELHAQGQYAEAEKLDRRALAIRLKVQKEEHPGTATSYNNLARDLFAQGQYAEAEKLDRQALAIFLKILKEEHRDTATSYASLARDLSEQDQYAEAEKLDRHALAILLKVLKEEHPDTATSYNNLARDLFEQGQYAEAEKLDRQALAINLKVLKEEHRDTAKSCNNLARDLFQQGQYAEAEKLDRQALAIRLKVLGPDHPDTALSCYNCAFLLCALGRYEAAETMALGGAKSFQAARLRISFTGLERSAFSAERSPMVFLACLLAHNGKPGQAWNALEENLGRGLFDDLTARTARPLKDMERRREETLLGRLANIDKRMPELLGGKAKNPEAADILRKERDGLMAELTEFQSAMVKNYGVLAGEVYGLERIQKSLAADAAIVAWIDIAGHAKSKNPAGDHWAVIVRNHGEPTCVRLTGIGRDRVWSEKDDELPGTVRGILHNPDLAHQDALAKLGRQRLGTLQKHLQGVRHLIVLNSPRMAGIPIEAMTDAYRISYAPSATMFTWLQEKRDPLAVGDKLLALGDAVFSPAQAKKAAAVAQLLRGSEKFTALPGTRFEVEQLAGLMKKHGGQVTPFLGVDANRVNLERLAEKNQLADFRYIHLATHAKADPKGSLNSFLVLSSENPDETNYATLSAGQILRTWKLNADLVTLSACETALGKHEGGEGYVGFSQALLLAGARTLVLSQWRVSDHASAAFMLRFYQNLLGERPGLQQSLSKIEALEEARRWLRGLPRAEALKLFADMPEDFRSKLPAGARPFEHPNYWAAFILVGDPGLARKP